MHAWSSDRWQLSVIECSHTTAHALSTQCTKCANFDLRLQETAARNLAP